MGIIDRLKNLISGAEITTAATKGHYTGPLPTYHLTKSNAQVIKDTVTWAKKVANNNDFHYGKGRHAHHNGCYYCGTQPKSKKNAGIKKWETTYCCNPFVGAAWAHGGCVPKALELCKKGSSWDYSKGQGYDTSPLFKKVGNPYKVKLKKGDVICGDSHVMLYVGDGYVVHAGYEDDNVVKSAKWKKSICKEKLKDSWHYKHKAINRVYRFTGKVDKDMTIYHGEYSYRVRDMQQFFYWYYNVKRKPTGFYNETTFKYVKKFQKEKGLDPTGKVGKKTIAKINEVAK